MSIDIFKLNGTSPFVNYKQFEETLRHEIERRCSDAKVFLFNNFPVSLSPETGVDLIIVMAVNPRKGNYYSPKRIEGRLVYLHNVIIPVKFISHYAGQKLTLENGVLFSEDEIIDYSSEIDSIKFGLQNYLAQRCGLEKKDLFIHPIINIQHDQSLVKDHYLVSKNFDFKAIASYLAKCSWRILISYKHWRSELSFSSINSDIESISDHASQDSQTGYITRKKIDRLAKQLVSSRAIFNDLNNHLIVISGKAGTGKSSELLLLMIKLIDEGKNTIYLTYNRLLMFDISKAVRLHVNARLNNSKTASPGEYAIHTLHTYFFRLSKSLGVLHVLSEKRIQSVLKILEARVNSISILITKNVGNAIVNFDEVKSSIQNDNEIDRGTKEVGIDFLNFSKRREANTLEKIMAVRNDFQIEKRKKAENIQVSEVFLADYYHVLAATLEIVNGSHDFFDKYNVGDKFDLLSLEFNLDEHDAIIVDGVPKISQAKFKELIKRKIGGKKRKRTVFVDEAQDCHRLEKDILCKIYGSPNIVVASGGKEQLIRHVEICNWEATQGARISHKVYPMRGKSYRVKKAVLHFCNFYATKYGIDLNLEPLESEDVGEIVFDFRRGHDAQQIIDTFKHLETKGTINGCTPYESLIVLLESSLIADHDGNLRNETTTVINEYDNVEEVAIRERQSWPHIDTLRKAGFMVWEGTSRDKSQLNGPYPNETRVIYYESCRGLECWSVACLALDDFFARKREDPDAEKYLIEDLFLSQNNEQRKSMYAATWVLMAMTRVIDTLYIQINDEQSAFGKIVNEYAREYPQSTIVYR